MSDFWTTWQPRILSVLRFITGFLFLWHGSQKLFGFPPPRPLPPGTEPPSFAFLVFSGGLEFVGGLLILIGLFTRWTAFVLCGMMAVAYWIAHGTKSFLPLQNGGELAVLYCFVFLYLFFAGGGEWSLDNLLKKKD
jgi:putative oxidoreductase